MTIGDSDPTQVPSGETRPPEPRPEPPIPAPERDYRYHGFERLGAGGGGEVWKAYDSKLRRYVAIKFPHADPVSIERFFREAKAAAALDHPAIAGVFETGVRDGRPYIAMQLIDGPSLRHHRGDRREFVRLLRDAARAIAYAHARGVIHRDLKPDNLLVADGRVYVTDFGLARLASIESTLSVTGHAIGTPAYMPPEQARGAEADARSDVYSLGATLYEVIAGRPPFQAGATPVLQQVVESEPTPPKGADARLAAVILKCLEKDPARRYATADEFADELDRWLEGKPVLAHRGFRVRRGTAVATGVIAALLLVGLATGIVAWRAQAARGDLVSRMRSTSQTCLAAALDQRRAGNLEAMARTAASLEGVCAEVIRSGEHAAEAHYHLGRLRRAMMERKAALESQERAIALDPSFAPARYERIVLLAFLWVARIEELATVARRRWETSHGRSRDRIFGPDLWRDDAAAKALRERIEADLPLAEPSPALLGIRSMMAGAADADVHFREALNADEAFELLANAYNRSARHAEAIELLNAAIRDDAGYTPFVIARARAKVWLYASTRSNRPVLEEARTELTEAIRRRPSDADAYVARAATVMWEGDPETIEGAIADLDRAIELEPKRAMSWNDRAVHRMNLAEALEGKGGDGGPLLDVAERDLAEALRLDPTEESGLHLAWIAAQRARFAAVRGGDADPAFAKAVARFEEFVERRPNHADAWARLAIVQNERSQHLEATGRNPDAALKAALAAFDTSLKLDDRDANAMMFRGVTRNLLAERESGDRTALYQEARRDMERSIEMYPELPLAHAHLGALLRDHRNWCLATGRDPGRLGAEAEEALSKSSSDFARFVRGSLRRELAVEAWQAGRDGLALNRGAEQDLLEALRGQPGRVEYAIELAQTYCNRGIAEIRGGRDPERSFEAALKALEAPLRRNPSEFECLRARAAVLSEWMRVLRPVPLAMARAAMADLDVVLAAEPKNFQALCDRGEARFAAARQLLAEERDAVQELEGSVADFGAALALDGSRTMVWKQRATSLINLGAALDQSGKDASKAYERAALDLGEVRRRAPDDLETLMLRGVAHMNRGLNDGRRGRDPRPALTAAIADFDEVIKTDATVAVAHFNRARSLQLRGSRADLEAAIQSFEAAVEADRRLESAAAKAIEECRRALKN